MEGCRTKTVLLVLDGVGIGALPDARSYGDEGANTLRHALAAIPDMELPNLARLGLFNIEGAPDGRAVSNPAASYGRMAEASAGKDTTTGHWELAGLVLDNPFPTFPNGFPRGLIDAFEAAIGRGILCNETASGTEVIMRLGDEHCATGKPIVYTSADSVFQIAMHEDFIPLEEQHRIARAARALLAWEYSVARVIMRPFAGASGEYRRTAARRDFSVPPFKATMLDMLKANGYAVTGIGKIEDIFAGQGLTHADHASGNAACTAALLEHMDKGISGLIFVNLVDFDMLYGHRRDPRGFALALKAIDDALPDILSRLSQNDMLIITADHGCDPSHKGTDHTREYVPLLVYDGIEARPIETTAAFTLVSEIILNQFNISGGKQACGKG